MKKLQLVIRNGSLAGQQAELESGSIKFGRHAECTLRFNHNFDPGVSGHHAIIESTEDGFRVRDLKSTNGTFLNGQQITESVLNHGDVIRLARDGPEIAISIEEKQQPPEITISEIIPEPAPPNGGGLAKTLTGIGFYAPQKSPAIKEERSYASIGVTVAIALIIGLILAAIMISIMGFRAAVVGAVMAIAPAPFYLLLFLWIDRYDPEPYWALLAAFGWGALFSLLVSFVVNTFFGSVAAALIGAPQGDALSAVVSAPLIEEATKGLGVVMVLVFMRKEFDGILDGLVYSGIIALGFATGENVLYYGKTFREAGFGGLLIIGFMRGVLSPFAHSLFTSMTGVGCGISRESHNPVFRILAPVAGYACAVVLHAMWNGIAHVLGNLFIVAYFIVWVPLFALFLVLIISMAKRERKIVKQMLAFEVATGTITAAELELIGSIIARVKWVASSFGNRDRLDARRRYLRAITKLGFCYWHVARANAANNQTISLPQIPLFKAEIESLKSRI